MSGEPVPPAVLEGQLRQADFAAQMCGLSASIPLLIVMLLCLDGKSYAALPVPAEALVGLGLVLWALAALDLRRRCGAAPGWLTLLGGYQVAGLAFWGSMAALIWGGHRLVADPAEFVPWLLMAIVLSVAVQACWTALRIHRRLQPRSQPMCIAEAERRARAEVQRRMRRPHAWWRPGQPTGKR